MGNRKLRSNAALLDIAEAFADLQQARRAAD
jgi:hypothetical protein